jgi:hypothetical protein
MAYAPGAQSAKRTGPPPDPNSLRSAKRGAEWMRLAKNVRATADVPEWPDYIAAPSAQEQAFWNELWHKPQSVLWLRDGIIHEVAMYCRAFISAMQPGGFVTEKTAAERMGAMLLLSVPALLAAKVMIVDDEEPDLDAVPGQAAPVREINSARRRTVIVKPAADDELEDENESSTRDDGE